MDQDWFDVQSKLVQACKESDTVARMLNELNINQSVVNKERYKARYTALHAHWEQCDHEYPDKSSAITGSGPWTDGRYSYKYCKICGTIIEQ